MKRLLRLRPWCLLLLSACTPEVSEFKASGAPTAVTYAENPVSYLRAQAIVPNEPHVSGATATLFTITPALPDGLTLDANAGIISGTPTSVRNAVDYTVVASNGQGSARTTLSLAVIDLAPTTLTYAAAVYVKGTLSAPNAPVVAGGLPTRFDVAPALPGGLAMNAITGVISGTPSVTAAAADYTISAANDFGSTTTTLSLSVADQAPALTFLGAPYVFVKNQPINTGTPDNAGGDIVDCRVAPGTTALPTGLQVSPLSCAVFGIPTETREATEYTLQVTFFGGVVEQTFTLTVNDTLRIVPPAITLTASTGRTFQFNGTGGVPPYSFTLQETGTELTLAGVYTALNSGGTKHVVVTDLVGSTAVATVKNVVVEVDGTVNTITSDASHKYLGGNFGAAQPDLAHNALRFDPATGTPDYGFDMANAFDGGSVSAIAVAPDAVYFGGSFTRYRGVPVANLVKVDRATGALDTTFSKSTGFDGLVLSLVYDQGALYVGGRFHFYKTVAANAIAKLDASSGALDTTFTSIGFSDGLGDPAIYAMQMSNGALYATGLFNGYRGVPHTCVVKLQPLTGVATAGFGHANYGDCQGFALLADPDSLFIGGALSLYDGSVVSNLVRVALDDGHLLTDGFTQPAAFHDVVSALASDATNLYVGGNFTTYTFAATPPATALRLAKLVKATGALSPGFTQGSFDGQVHALALVGDKLIVGGDFRQYVGGPARNIIKLEANTGAADSTLPARTGFNSQVLALANDGNAVIAAGQFRSFGGTAVGNIASFSLLDGAFDQNFANVAFDGEVNALAEFQNDLYVGGEFITYSTPINPDQPAEHLAKISKGAAVLDQTFTQTTGFNGSVFALLIDPATPGAEQLYVGGAFTTYRTTTAVGKLARISSLATGALIGAPFTSASGGFSNTGSSAVRALTLCGTGFICVGGTFNKYRGVAAPQHIARMNKNDGTITIGGYDAGFDSATTNGVTALAYDASGIYVGGRFSKYKGVACEHLIKLTTGGAVDVGFAAPTVTGFVTSIAITPSSLYVLGPDSIGTTATAGFARMSLDSAKITPGFAHSIGFDVAPSTLTIVGGTLAVGGAFETYDGVVAPFSTLIDPVTGDLAQ